MLYKRNYYNGSKSIDKWVIFNTFFYKFLSNTTEILTPICHSCSFGFFSWTRLARYCYPQLMSILILLIDKHVYTDLYAYPEIYENVKVTPMREFAMVILIRSSRPSVRCPRMPTRFPQMPSHWVRQSHDVPDSTHDWNRSMYNRWSLEKG